MANFGTLSTEQPHYVLAINFRSEGHQETAYSQMFLILTNNSVAENCKVLY